MTHPSRLDHRVRMALTTALTGALALGGLAAAPSVASAAPAPASAKTQAQAQAQAQAQVSRAAPAAVRAPAVTRAEILRRAKTWLTANNGSQVPYSQSKVWSDGYRQDCSGYVSMTLGLWKSGPNTVELAGNRSLTTPISLGALKPGDLLIDADGSNTTRHVVIFDGWTDSSHSAYRAYEQRGGHGTDHRVLTYGLDGGSEFKPYRPVNIADGGGDTPAPPPPATGWTTLSQGSTGAAVKAAQHLLAGHGHRTTADGDFGPATLAQVKAFQRARNLAADGIVGPKTWKALVKTVARGASGKAVRAAQTALNARGFRLAVDGAFGPRTDAAVRGFQQRKGLAVDGVVGPKTWRALLGA